MKELSPLQRIERSLTKKFRSALWRPFIGGIKQYDLIRPDDKIAVCISGGKDSMLLAKLMQALHRHSDFPFSLKFLVMDPGYDEQSLHKIEANAALLQIPVTRFKTDIFEIVNKPTVAPVIYAPECGAAIFMPKREALVVIKSRSDTTFPTWLKLF